MIEVKTGPGKGQRDARRQDGKRRRRRRRMMEEDGCKIVTNGCCSDKRRQLKQVMKAISFSHGPHYDQTTSPLSFHICFKKVKM